MKTQRRAFVTWQSLDKHYFSSIFTLYKFGGDFFLLAENDACTYIQGNGLCTAWYNFIGCSCYKWQHGGCIALLAVRLGLIGSVCYSNDCTRGTGAWEQILLLESDWVNIIY